MSASPNPQTAGGTVNITITVSNNGQSAAPVEVLSPAAAGLQLLSANGGATFSCGDPSSSQILSCSSLTPLAGGASANITLIALISNPCIKSPIVQSAQVDPSSLVVEGNELNNFASVAISVIGCPTVTPTGAPTSTITPTSAATATSTASSTPTATPTPSVDLSVIKVATPGIAPAGGGLITYTLQVVNNGTVAVSGVTVNDVMDTNNTFGIAFVSAAGSAGSNFVCTSNGVFLATVTCTGGNIGANGGVTITIFAQTFGGCPGAIVNNATVDPGFAIPEFNETNNSFIYFLETATCATSLPTNTPLPTSTPTRTLTPTLTSVPASGLTFTKTVNPNVIIIPNGGGFGSTQYTLTITNNTAGTISGIVVRDNFGPTPITSAVASGTQGFGCVVTAGPLVECSGGSIPAGQSATISITVQVSSGIAPCNSATAFNNIATIDSPPVVNSIATRTASCATMTPTPNLTATALALTPTATFTATATFTPSPTPVGFDLDTQFVDVPVASGSFQAPVVPENLVTGPAQYTSIGRYVLGQDDTGGSITVTLSGTLSGTAPRSSLTVSAKPGSTMVFEATTNPWTCGTTGTTSWTCTGNLGSDTSSGGNDSTVVVAGQDFLVTVDVIVEGTGSTGQTIVYSAVTTGSATLTCTPTCISSSVSPGNNDGSAINFASDTDTLP